MTQESFVRQLKALSHWKGVRGRLAELKVPVLVAKQTGLLDRDAFDRASGNVGLDPGERAG